MNIYFYFTIFLLCLICNLLFIFFNKYLTFNNFKNNQVQNIHINPTSRMGGLSIFIIWSYCSLIYFNQQMIIILFSTLFIIPAIAEDIGFVIKPKIRLIGIFLGSFLIILATKKLPQFDFEPLNHILNNYYFQIIFYSFCLSIVINGQNFIDGVNGLSAFTSVSIFISLLYFGIIFDDQELKNKSAIVIVLLFSFLILNYPFGKIFLGDTGSYFLGFYGGFEVIQVLSKYSEIPTWTAVTILFYPTLEVVFSFTRKLLKNTSPFKADEYHLHFLVYRLISRKSYRNTLSNSLVAPLLSVIWLTPIATLPFSLKLSHISLFAVFFLVLIYVFFYILILKAVNRQAS